MLVYGVLVVLDVLVYGVLVVLDVLAYGVLVVLDVLAYGVLVVLDVLVYGVLVVWMCWFMVYWWVLLGVSAVLVYDVLVALLDESASPAPSLSQDA